MSEKWPQSEDEMLAQIREALAGHEGWAGADGYNRAPEAVAKAALAAIRYAAHTLGITGFQASVADLMILKETRHLKGPFGIIDGEHLLYPQYDLRAELEEWIARWRKELAPLARQYLAEHPNAHPDVLSRWREIANQGAN